MLQQLGLLWAFGMKLPTEPTCHGAEHWICHEDRDMNSDFMGSFANSIHSSPQFGLYINLV